MRSTDSCNLIHLFPPIMITLDVAITRPVKAFDLTFSGMKELPHHFVFCSSAAPHQHLTERVRMGIPIDLLVALPLVAGSNAICRRCRFYSVATVTTYFRVWTSLGTTLGYTVNGYNYLDFRGEYALQCSAVVVLQPFHHCDVFPLSTSCDQPTQIALRPSILRLHHH